MSGELVLADDANARDTLSLIALARHSLAEARTLPDIRRVLELASVAVDAAQRAARLAEAQHAAAEVVNAASDAANDAAAVRIEAQAKAGELLRQMMDRGERDPGHGDRRSESQAATPKLADLGVSKSDSSRWQQVASVPPEVRQQYVDETKAVRAEVSTRGLLRHARTREESSSLVRTASRHTIDHAAIAAEATKRMRAVYRQLIDLPRYRPESLVSALDNSERHKLLRALRQLPAWIAMVESELAIHRVVEEE